MFTCDKCLNKYRYYTDLQRHYQTCLPTSSTMGIHGENYDIRTLSDGIQDNWSVLKGRIVIDGDVAKAENIRGHYNYRTIPIRDFKEKSRMAEYIWQKLPSTDICKTIKVVLIQDPDYIHMVHMPEKDYDVWVQKLLTQKEKDVANLEEINRKSAAIIAQRDKEIDAWKSLHQELYNAYSNKFGVPLGHIQPLPPAPAPVIPTPPPPVCLRDGLLDPFPSFREALMAMLTYQVTTGELVTHAQTGNYTIFGLKENAKLRTYTAFQCRVNKVNNVVVFILIHDHKQQAQFIYWNPDLINNLPSSAGFV